MNLILHQMQIGALDTNCYLFGDKTTKEIVIVDPAEEDDRIINYIKDNNYNVKYIILTHGHFDHIGGVKKLKEFTDAQVLIHEYDKDMLINPNKNFSALVGMRQSIQVEQDIVLKDGDVFDLGGKKFTIIHTPGHTKGGICILFENNLFSGDTLFRETVGRTDLGGSYSEIIDSLGKLMRLDDKINVFPGHGSETTIGHERKNNVYVNEII